MQNLYTLHKEYKNQSYETLKTEIPTLIEQAVLAGKLRPGCSSTIFVTHPASARHIEAVLDDNEFYELQVASIGTPCAIEIIWAHNIDDIARHHQRFKDAYKDDPEKAIKLLAIKK